LLHNILFVMPGHVLLLFHRQFLLSSLSRQPEEHVCFTNKLSMILMYRHVLLCFLLFP
jgi:hypothetical protein